MKCFAGIDIGSATTKAVIINENKDIIGYALNNSGANFENAADLAYANACDKAGLNHDDCIVTSTGYGRRNVAFASNVKTEISCHAVGSFHYFAYAHTLIDIGGQDSKTIKINSAGKRENFKMNRKCAAGTGAFLEEIANRLKIELSSLNDLAEKSENDIAIGSYCTVFTGTEILARIREGVAIEDIIKGIFDSVIKRIFEMDPMDSEIVMSGGVVAHNPYIVKMLEDRIEKKIAIPPLPQLTGAFGAALCSIEKFKEDL